ncbi:enoyl-CoA hydratase [Lacisediminimonas sp.]|uniref:enoyl-CoA hydratase n=1 Tax=Lacisediminimonas sp. TaxID=3060582 RepID=UPI00271CFE3A|nr:enoyl-CoA hydratase [Lacisediminimonas sp.]MDO8298687.1 enoyl-CoA hydratase [Lacisediminimonas sp.]MDO9217999.1 enoyl-CoA hydratase [Lacisediminimonas sp.]
MSIATSKQDGILTIEFDRPERKNAITVAMYQLMADAIAQGERDPEVRVLLICGKPDMFTAGNDLEDFLGAPPPGLDSPVFAFMRTLSQASKPVVAAVAGPAVGIGTTMLLHCDMVYAADNALFSMPFAQLGVCPEFASSMVLPQIAGYQRAAELLMLGETFTAAQACQMGMVNKVVPGAELMPYARSKALALVALPPSSLRITKQLMKSAQSATVQKVIADEGRHFSAMLGAPEAKEAFTAFFQKRKPDFSRFD